MKVPVGKTGQVGDHNYQDCSLRIGLESLAMAVLGDGRTTTEDGDEGCWVTEKE